MKKKERPPQQLSRDLERIRREVSILRAANERHHRDKQALSESEEKYRTVLEASMDAMFLETLVGEVLDCNDRACEMYGYSKDEMIGLTVADLVPKEIAEQLPKFIEEQRDKGGMMIEALGKKRDGSVFPTEVSTKVVTIGGEKLVATFVRDISERKEAEEERRKLEEKIRQARKLESLGLLSAGAAHDFGNIATAVMCDAGLLRLRFGDNERALKDIRNIEDSCRRAGELCERMIAFSGEGRMDFRDVDVNMIVEETAQIMKSQVPQNVELKMQLGQKLKTIRADETMIRQVVMNLLKNAVEAVNGGTGKISVTTLELACDRGFLDGTLLDGDLPEGRYLCVEVKDTGKGMDKKTVERIFDPFFTKKVTGRGLGLASVLGIIRGHKGTIKVVSKPGKGTTFGVYFPSEVSAAGEEQER